MARKINIVNLTDETVSVDFTTVAPLGDKQAQFIWGDPEDWHRFSLFCGSRASGKTYALMWRALALAMLNPGFPGVVLSRTLVDADDTLIPQFEANLAAFERHTGISLVRSVDKGLKRWTLINGSTVVFRPFDRISKVRGKSYAWMLVDEIEHGSTDSVVVWETLLFCLRGYKHAPYPSISVATTPDGLRGVIQLFHEAQRSGSPFHTVTHSTLYDAVDGGWVTMEELESFKASCSKRMWKQEGLGEVLRPRHTVYDEYDEDRHLVPWTWDRSLPFGVGIDWGEARACAVAVQFVDHVGYITRDGVEYPVGTWIVADELVLEQTSRPKFFAALVDWIDRIGGGAAPSYMAADRAVRSENSRLRGKYESAHTEVGTCITKDEQAVRKGISAVQFMLDPLEGPPRLYLADHLTEPTTKELGGIRKSMMFYGYHVDFKTGLVTDRPKKDGTEDSGDALRYLVVKTAQLAQYHGGRPLEYFNPTAANLRDWREAA